ncbi:hypothetical protein [uncultured Maribacter sp.]|uniref:hypothetical protein n=1 Tax=uncultured Maribacter sp. TaxID=431308 RepID=UPI002630908E|nr:hypothetical protein [uncultured Maribacter sp.]
MAVASKKEILEHLDSIDLNDLLDRMEHYVHGRFYNKSERIREGVDYLDFCYEVLTKACSGVRNWDKEKATFEEFAFGCLKSDLYNFFRKLAKKNKGTNNEIEQEVYLIEINEFTDLSEIEAKEEPPDIDFNEISKDALISIKEQGADDLEIKVFECWLAGYFKPQEIAELCDGETFEINNAIKRLSRKTIELKKKWASLKK